MANINPLVSIIIPCYNQASFLPDAIASLLKQSLQNWECIIVNDGSKDNTAEVAEKLAATDNRISVINQANKGLSGARNSGLKAAKGDMLQFLDADDMLEHEKLKVQHEFMVANPDVDIVISDARYFNTENPQAREYGLNHDYAWVPARWNAEGSDLEKFLKDNLFPVNCPLIRRSVFDVVGEWTTDLASHEDWEFWLRCAIKRLRFAYLELENSFALIRAHENSMSTDRTRMYRTIIDMRCRVGPKLPTSKLRVANFCYGLKVLPLAYPEGYKNQLLSLLVANFSLSTLLKYIGAICAINNLPPAEVSKMYRQTIPWRLQQLIAAWFGSETG